jgi:hypothetical protein
MLRFNWQDPKVVLWYTNITEPVVMETHVHYRIISIRGEVCTHKASLTQHRNSCIRPRKGAVCWWYPFCLFRLFFDFILELGHNGFLQKYLSNTNPDIHYAIRSPFLENILTNVWLSSSIWRQHNVL